MISKSVDEAEHEAINPYVSCIRINGRPILPPLMTPKRRDEMRHYKELAELVATKLESKKNSLKDSIEATPITQKESLLLREETIVNKETTESFLLSEETKVTKEATKPVATDHSFKCVDTQEILEEFDPFAPSTLNSARKSRLSGSSDELSASKTGSSNTSVAMTNSTDLYHYMDITGSSLGDGRTTRRSLTPLTGGEWDSPPSKTSHQIEVTYEGLNEYLDSILISSASSLPSRTICSKDETTPTNVLPLQNLASPDVQILELENDERPKSCPLSPIPRDSISDSAIGSLSEKLIDVVGEPIQRESESNVPRLVRSNSYTLDAPSPMLLAHLEAEKKKNTISKVSNKQKVVVNNRSKACVWNGERLRNGVIAPKRNESQSLENRVTLSPQKKAKSLVAQVSTSSTVNKTRVPSSPRSPKVGVAPPKTNEVLSTELIGQLDVRKLFADLQAEHNRQMEQLLIRQRKEQEMIRQSILARKDLTRATQTWAQCLGSNHLASEPVGDEHSAPIAANTDSRSSQDIRKSLSSSFIMSSPEKDRVMTVSAPPGSLCLTMPSSPKRPSSSPSLTSCSVFGPPLEVTDTNGNLTKDLWIVPQQGSAPECVSSETQSPVSPRTRRRAWDSQRAITEDPDWLEINRQRQMHWAASKIQASVRGYLTRRLLRTERVQGCITVIHDTILCALELQKECSRNVEPSDLELHGRLIHQLGDACKEIHSIFVEIPVAKRMAIITLDRERLESRSSRANGPRPLSRATQIVLSRKMAQNSHIKSNTAGSTASTTRRKNWANINMKGKTSSSSCTQESSEIVPSCPVRNSTTTTATLNGDTQKSVSGVQGGGSRKPWR